ncbi:MAG: ABC transporter permease [Acidobacteriota bacterium]
METLRQHLRFAARILFKNPSFTLIAVVTLALGIGATTAMFSVVNGVLLSALPFADPDRLVTIKNQIPKLGPTPFSVPAPDVLTYQREAKSFTDVAGYREVTYDLTGQGEPRKVQGARLTANVLSVLRAAPILGRNFTPEEDHIGNEKVVILSYRMWRSLFASDPNVLDRTITLDRKPYTVVGVMGKDFVFPIKTQLDASELWVPMAFTEEERKSVGDNFGYNIVARLKSGVSLAQARADVERVAQIIRDGYPAAVKSQFEVHGVIIGLREDALGDYRRPILIMLLSVVFVLLIGITNVANLLLTKGISRQRELSIRIALGATGRRIITQLVTESVLLGLLGGALGLVLANLGTEALVAAVPANIPRLHSVEMDWRVFLFAFAISALSGLIFGAAPAMFGLRVNVNNGLKEGGRSMMSGPQHRYARTGFIVAQFSLALMLLIGAGLLIRSFERVLQVDPGFQTTNIVSGAISLPDIGYKEDSQRRAFDLELIRRLENAPGVEFAGAGTDLPLESGWSKIFSIEGQVPPPGAGLNVDSHTVVLGGYFQTLGIPLIRGRFFNDADTQKSTRVVIVNKTLADRYFHGQDPIGHRMKWGPPESDSYWMTIIGVVGDVKQFGLEKDVVPQTYENYLQYRSFSDLSVVLRGKSSAQNLITALQTTVHSLDPQLPITRLRTMEEVMSQSIAPRRFYLILVLVFAASAIVLAAVGLYGVVAHAVEQRTREFGIRMSLGAARSDVLKLLLRWALSMVALGVVTGIVGSVAITRVLSGFLFGIKPTDPVTFLAVPSLLAIVALLASYIPARQATKVDPIIALRDE